MSQRARSSIDKHGGVAAAAVLRGLHLVELTGDNGTLLVAPAVTLQSPLLNDLLAGISLAGASGRSDEAQSKRS